MSVTLTLTYPDRPDFIVGGFPTEADALAWLAKAQQQADWDPATTYTIQDSAPPAGP